VAIKGKSKSRGAKTVTSGPKPAYVPVKTPLLRRRGLWIAVGTVLVVALVAGLAYGFARERTQSRDQERLGRMAAAVNDYRGQVEPILAPLGQAVPPSSFSAFASLGSSIDAIRAEQVDQAALDAAASEADASVSRAKNAADLFEQISPTDIVADQGFSQEFVLYIINSQDGFDRAMRLYRQAALLVADAVAAKEPAARAELVARASDVYDLADTTFARAYDDYVQAQFLANVFVAPSAGGATGSLLTGPTG
jgi:hypothetical protein